MDVSAWTISLYLTTVTHYPSLIYIESFIFLNFSLIKHFDIILDSIIDNIY